MGFVKQILFSRILLRGSVLMMLAGIMVLVQIVYMFGVIGFNARFAMLALLVPSEISQHVNAERLMLGLPALTIDERLMSAAQKKANDMAMRGYFSHTTPEGESVWSTIIGEGYAFRTAGENLAVNFSDSARVVSAWMASPSHRANIVDSSYQDFGFAIAEGERNGKRTFFIVGLFASRTSLPTAFAVPSVPQIALESAPSAVEVVSRDVASIPADVIETAPEASQVVAGVRAPAQTPEGSLTIDEEYAGTLLARSMVALLYSLIFCAVFFSLLWHVRHAKAHGHTIHGLSPAVIFLVFTFVLTLAHRSA